MDVSNSTLSPSSLLAFVPVALSLVWIVWDLFYASRVLAFLVKTLANWRLKDSAFHIGGLRLDILSGRLIFKDVQYYCRDYSVRVADGYAVLRWWKQKESEYFRETGSKCQKCSGFSQALVNKDSALAFVYANSFEFHWYNRSGIYDKWGNPYKEKDDVSSGGGWLKQIQPTLHVCFRKGRMTFGNHLIQNSLVITFEHADGHYALTSASNPYDEMMHLVQWHGDFVEAVLEPSEGYSGNETESLLLNGAKEGTYPVLRSDSVECTYSLDLPGLVPIDVISSPKFSFDIHLGSNTVFNYGCYANRQRRILQYFFFPNDYTTGPVVKMPSPGEKRIYTELMFSVLLTAPGTLNWFFREKEELKHITFDIAGNSHLFVHQPWINTIDGYVTTLDGVLHGVSIYSSLDYPSLARTERVQISSTLSFPREWNSCQKWNIGLQLYNSSACVLFSYVPLFNALLDDWIGPDESDLLEFVPVNWKIAVELSDYEIFVTTNRYNWIDNAPDGRENTQLAFCGRTGHLNFILQFMDFLPNIQPVFFAAKGHDIVVRRYTPPSSSTRESLFALSDCNKQRWKIMERPVDRSPRTPFRLTRSVSQPIEPIQPKSHHFDSASSHSDGSSGLEVEEFKRAHFRRGSEPLLPFSSVAKSSLSGKYGHKSPSKVGVELMDTKSAGEQEYVSDGIESHEHFPMGSRNLTQSKFGWLDVACGPSVSIDVSYEGRNGDASHENTPGGRMIPSVVSVTVDAPKVLFRVFGCLLRDLIGLQEGFVGEYMYFKTFNSQSSTLSEGVHCMEEKMKNTEPDLTQGPHNPDERFLNIIVDFKLHSITGEFPTHLPINYPKDFPLPSAFTDLLSVNVSYSEDETTVRLCLDSVTFHLPAMGTKEVSRKAAQHNLGHLVISSVEFNCHGLTEFMLQERVEYAWMMRLNVGKVFSSVSVDELMLVVDWLHTAVSHFVSYGDGTIEAPQAVLIEPRAEPLSEILKYKMFVFNIGGVDFLLLEENSLIRVQSPGVNCDLCNLHNTFQTYGVSVQLLSLIVSAFITTKMEKATHLECGRLDIGTINCDMVWRDRTKAMPQRQYDFLRRADMRQKRLHFIWKHDMNCGCCGGCQFLEHTVKRSDDDYMQSIFHFSRYFKDVNPTDSNGGTGTSSTEKIVCIHSFRNLSSVENLHKVLLTHYHLQTDKLNDTKFLLQSTPDEVLVGELQMEAHSQASDSSFVSARESLSSLDNIEKFGSVHNSPQVSQLQSKLRKKVTESELSYLSPKQKPKPNHTNNHFETTHYQNIMDSYEVKVKVVKLLSASPIPSSLHGQNTCTLPCDFGTRSHPNLQLEYAYKTNPSFLLMLPTVVHSQMGTVPMLVPSDPPACMNTGAQKQQMQTDCRSSIHQEKEQAISELSISVELAGGIGAVVSPPLISVAEMYISRLDTLFCTRSGHSLLDFVTLETFAATSRRWKRKSMDPPLLHLSVHLNPNAIAVIQLLQCADAELIRKKMKPEFVPSFDVIKHSLVSVYTSGLKCDVIVSHTTSTVPVSEGDDPSTEKNQSTTKVSCNVILPVLQAGLFTWLNSDQETTTSSRQSRAPTDPSVLQFGLQPPSSHGDIFVTKSIVQTSMNQACIFVAAEIAQFELESDPFLGWDCIHAVHCDRSALQDHTTSNYANKSNLALKMKVSSFQTLIAGPKTGIPSSISLSLDPSITEEIVHSWKSQITAMIISLKVFQKRKQYRDRMLILGLLVCGSESPTKIKVRNPLADDATLFLRSTVLYDTVIQLWHSLSQFDEKQLDHFPSNIGQSCLKKEIIAVSLSLGTKLLKVRTLLMSRIQGSFAEDGFQHSSSTISDGYHSISPAPSLLAVPNIRYKDPSVGEVESCEGQNLFDNMEREVLVLIRESLLAFYNSSNLELPPQLKKLHHRSIKARVSYQFSIEEGTLIVTDGRKSANFSISSSVLPELLLHGLHANGTLKYMFDSQALPSAQRTSMYLITVPCKRDLVHMEKNSNMISKCSLSIGSIATNISIPLMMVLRHTKESFRERKTMINLQTPVQMRGINSTQLPVSTCHQSLTINQPGVQCSPMWSRIQLLLQHLSSIEEQGAVVASFTASISNSPGTSHLASSKEPENISSSKCYYSLPSTKLSESLNIRTSQSAVADLLHKTPAECKEPRPYPSISYSASVEHRSSPVDNAADVEQDTAVGISVESAGYSTTMEIVDDTTDSMQVFSSDNEATAQRRKANNNFSEKVASKVLYVGPPNTLSDQELTVFDLQEVRKDLSIPDDQLQFSFFGLVKVKQVSVTCQVESFQTALEVNDITGSVDFRKKYADRQFPTSDAAVPTNSVVNKRQTQFAYKVLPTYLSVASRFELFSLSVLDPAISQSELAVLRAHPLEVCTGFYDTYQQLAPVYRALFRIPGVQIDFKEPPVVLHKHLHTYIPSFAAIYEEVFAPGRHSCKEEQTTSTSPVNVKDLQFPPYLPQGCAVFSLKWLHLVMNPLPSLTVTYEISPLAAQLLTSALVKFSISVGQHNLEFSPKTHKDELSLRYLPLPVMHLLGVVTPSPHGQLPRIFIDVAIKQLIIDVTTDVLNQLLILQTSFIKEINELLSMFFNIGESLPQEHIAMSIKQQSESSSALISLISSVKLSVMGIQITVSTPALRTATALRFSTGNRIEMLITNLSHQQNNLSAEFPGTVLPTKGLSLQGKVETEINIALGYLQEGCGIQDEDDFVELAYFKTWITVKNTLQQNAVLAGVEDDAEQAISLDTFLISIHSPHLYIQSTAVEKAILFWVNCKSVYNYWQNMHKQLNAEVQAATEALVEKITKPSTQLRTPAFDFSKPRLVQISVTDVGACMPLIPQPTTPHSSQKGFPAMVLTIKDMQVSVNLSRKPASAGHFSGFCFRFDEQFYFRHKTWTIDPQRHKFLNYGVVPDGTYRLCIVNKKASSPVGEEAFQVVGAFTWHMSGIMVNSSTNIGQHISTLVKTLTTIGSDLEAPQSLKNTPTAYSVGSPRTYFGPGAGSVTRRRAKSYSSRSFFDEEAALRSMELDLARQTRKLQRLRLTGATPDCLQSEEDTFHQLEWDLARGLRRVFRKGKGMPSLQQISQILSPRTSVVVSSGGQKKVTSNTLPRKRFVQKDTEKEGEAAGSTSSYPRKHVRHKSDITDVVTVLRMEDDLRVSEARLQGTDVEEKSSDIHKEPVLSVMVIEEEASDEHPQSSQEQGLSTDIGRDSGTRESTFFFPSIDIEVNVTISIDSGSILLHSGTTASQDHVSAFKPPILEGLKKGKERGKQHHSVDTKILIPALQVKASYQTILTKTWTERVHESLPRTDSPQDCISVPPEKDGGVLRRVMFETTDLSQGREKNVTFSSDNHVHHSAKKGALSIAAIVAPLPHDLELNPSILDFVAQVIRPISVGTHNGDDESDIDFNEIDEEGKEQSKVISVTSKNRSFSFPVEVCITLQIHPSKVILTCNPHSRVRCLLEVPTVSFVMSFSLFSKKQLARGIENPESSLNLSLSSQSSDDTIMLNNLNVTGCLKTFALVLYTPQVQSSSAKLKSSKIEDKEAFNLLLGRAFTHFSRASLFLEGASVKSVDEHEIHQKVRATVIPMIESLFLAYDMRRLNDVTWFRKCWYNTSLVEALFKGSVAHGGEQTSLNQLLDFSDKSSQVSSIEEKPEELSDVTTAEVAFAMSIADLRLFANVAQVMGNVHVLVSHLKSEAHADIQESELAFLHCNGYLQEIEVEAQGGVVAGNMKIKNTELNVVSSRSSCCIPDHKGSASIAVIQGYIDYMSAHIVFLQATNLLIKAKDMWKVVQPELLGSKQDATMIQICIECMWSTLQITVHRSTTKGLFGIVQRLYDFVMQQKKRSERTIGLMIPAGTAASSAFAAYQEEQKRTEESRAAEIENPLLERHHWLWAMRIGSLELLKVVGIHTCSFANEVSLGGSISVFGQNMCFVCFNGNTFRDNEWAVFNVDDISACFITNAFPDLGSFIDPHHSQEVSENEKRKVYQQICTLELGSKGTRLKELAAIYRVSASRGGVPPVSTMEIKEWLNYACIYHHIHADDNTSPSSHKSLQKLTIQPVLCLPAFSVNLTNSQFWLPLNILQNYNSEIKVCATVECSLESNFSEGISVTTTVDHYLFLHDLIKSYIDYIEKHQTSFRPPFTGTSSLTSSFHVPVSPPVASPELTTTNSSSCFRDFVCVKWELDPHLLLMSKALWASGQFNPHISWLLEMLGFKEACTTIPKWIQRGLMDPLDLGIASLVELLVRASATKKVRLRQSSPSVN